jgi:ribosomal protein S18 acetylase RimI-like enzyme
MRSIEELSMNAWPSIQNQFIDGWIIRFANGYTKRSNSVNPLYYSSKDVNGKIELCEHIFKKKKLNPIFKITLEVFPIDLDNILENKGYKAIDYTSVQILDLLDIDEPKINNINIYTEINEEWINCYYKLKSINIDDKIIFKKILENITNEIYFVSLLLNEKVIACGFGVLEDEYIGLFDIIVDINYRKYGYGEQLIKNIIKIAKGKGVKKAYLQVMLKNIPALNLYKKIGFKELYQYWYRIKE